MCGLNTSHEPLLTYCLLTYFNPNYVCAQSHGGTADYFYCHHVRCCGSEKSPTTEL